MDDKVIFNNTQYISRMIALISFLIGTGLFILYRTFLSTDLAIYGLYYIIVAFVINLVVLFVLIIMFAHTHADYKENLISIGAVLANIPIALFYVAIVFSGF